MRGARAAPLAAPYSGAGSARRSSLPLAVSGSASSATKADGTMYSGRRSRQSSRSAAASIVRSAAGDHIGDQPPVAGLVLAYDHRCLRHRRVTYQRGLDLAGLDAEPRIFTW